MSPSRHASASPQPPATDSAPVGIDLPVPVLQYDADSTNVVFLRGRLADEPAERELPSGDVLVTFRLTVTRPSSPASRPGSGGRVDSIECATVRPRVRRTLLRTKTGELLDIQGCLHRRFWRSPGGVASRYTVDVDTVRVTPGRRGAASPGRTRASA